MGFDGTGHKSAGAVTLLGKPTETTLMLSAGAKDAGIQRGVLLGLLASWITLLALVVRVHGIDREILA